MAEADSSDSDIEAVGTSFVLDAEQDEETRRDIRRKYRDLSKETQAGMDKLEEAGPEEINQWLDRGDALFKNVTTTREAALDSHHVHMCAQILKRNTETLNANMSEFKPLEFAEKLVAYLGNPIDEDTASSSSAEVIPRENWIKFGKEVMPMFKKVPALHYMFGSFETSEVPQEQRKRRAPRAKDDEEVKVVVPKQVAEIAKSEQETTTEEVQRVLGILQYLYEQNDRDPLCYFQFVTDPNSFGHTVENIFHVSFLVKDNLAGITLDEHELPVIWPTSEQEQDEAKNKEPCQFVMTLTMDDWAEIVDTFKFTKPLIPPRSTQTT